MTTDANADRIDLRELFKGQPITTATVDQYIKVTDAGMIQIDRDGAGSRYSMTNLLQLSENKNKDNILLNGQLLYK